MKKIKVFFVVALIIFASCIPKVSASSIGPQFDGKFAYNINLDSNYYWYIFPANSVNPKVLSFTDNVNTYELINFNSTFFFNGEQDPIIPFDVNQYIWCFNIDLGIQGESDYVVTISAYTKSVYNANAVWEFQNTKQFDVAIEDESFLLFSNNILYLANYTGGLSGVSAVERVFNNYLVGGGNALDNYIDTLKNSEFDRGYNAGLNEQLSNQNWWINLWEGVDAFLSVELLPNLTFGLLFSVPLVFGVLHLILFIWRSGD